MAKKKIDFYKLGNELWNIANIFRDDTLKTTEYLEEFSYFLFLKLFDDQEKQREEAAKLDGKKYIPYLPEELRFYTWANKIIDGEIPINEVVSIVKEIFQNLAIIKDHDGKDLSLFRRLFRNHIWRIKYGPTIRDLLKKLIDIELEQNFDVMGRAYEFVVQKLGEQKQYGQYFTPRHIIHFMVELADPEIGEKIYDPAAGTGGFILRSFETVLKKIEKEYKHDYALAEKHFRELKERNLWAVEKAPDVHKLALMNMILHNDGKSNLYESDSLDNRAQSEHKQKYNVVLSNPPYGPLTQSRVGVFDYHVKRFEALFIQHIMNALKFSEPNKKPSRAVVIILDKIVFDSTNAFKNIRKKLLREYNLKAVFSMPAGIFQPYSGVKTTVLYFERPTKDEWDEIKKNNEYATKHIMFFDIKTDGFTLSTQRRPINGAFQGDNPNIYKPPCGDLPKAVEVFREWQKALEKGNIEEFKGKYVDNEQVWIADIEEIKEKDFNLNPGLYRKVERGEIKWEWVRLGDLCNYIMGFAWPSKKYKNMGMPIIRIQNLGDNENEKFVYWDYDYDNKYLVENGDLLIGLSGSFKVTLWDKGNALLNQRIVKLLPDESKILKKYLFYVVKTIAEKISEGAAGSTIANAKIGVITNLEIPLPSLEIQQKIVERLDKQQAIIEKAKEMEKAIIEAGIDNAIFEGNWEWVELGDVVNLRNGIGLSNKYISDKGKYPVFGGNGRMGYTDKDEKLFSNETIVIGRVGEYCGNVHYTNKTIWITDNAIVCKLKPEIQNILPKFVYFFLKSKNLRQFAKLTGQPYISQEPIKSLKIPLPPLEKQKEIVEFLDVQLQTLEKLRKMRENAEKTIKLILEKEVFGDD